MVLIYSSSFSTIRFFIPKLVFILSPYLPTKLLPLWDLLGLGLGFGSTILGKKAAMLCTASVEEVIDGHYKSQIDQIGSDENDLKNNIIKFRNDEIHHKDIAYDNGATKEGFYAIIDKVIKTGSKLAIKISEKI